MSDGFPFCFTFFLRSWQDSWSFSFDGLDDDQIVSVHRQVYFRISFFFAFAHLFSSH